MFDLASLRRTIAQHGPVARVVIASVEGSSPREVGASMLVWATGQSGTIGGGALEWQAIGLARSMLGTPPTAQVTRVPLGPALGQCCGGAVTLLTEIYTDTAHLPDDVIARSLDGRPMPLAVKRLLDRARAQGATPAPTLLQGWFIEPVARPTRHLWIWGAGHVGRALVNVMAPLPDLAITWVDVAADRYPGTIPAGVTALPAADAAALVPHAPKDADHLILTYSHALDLDLCHRLLAHGFASAGLIGSATKWARFRSRLAALGHAPQSIARIRCPIGDTALGKHPQAIAIGVATAYLTPAPAAARQEITG
jgi:xanthine dehydrogenase accessory factor